MSNKNHPTPVPTDIRDRENYSFFVTIEGPKIADDLFFKSEALTLLHSLLGTLARAYPDRWSNVQLCLDASGNPDRG